MELALFRTLYALLSLLLVLPLWVSPYPPLVDLPQHAGQVSAALAWLEGAPSHRDVFELNPLTPYLGSYLVAGPLVALFGPSTGLRLTLSLALIGLPLATSHLLRTVRAPAWWVIPVFAVAPGYAFHWGFLGFVIATPLGVLGLSMHLRFLGCAVDRGQVWRAFPSALLALACFVAHALVFAWLALCAGLVTWLRRGPALRARLAGSLALLAPAPLALLWLLRTVGGPGRAEASIVWGVSLDRVGQLPSRVAGSLAPDGSLDLLGLLILASPFLLGARLGAGRTGWVLVSATLGLCWLGPSRVMSATYLPWRYAVFIVPALLLALRPTGSGPTGSGWTRWRLGGTALAVTLAALPSVSNLRSFERFGEQISGFRQVGARVPAGARVAYLAFGKTTPELRGPALLHFGQWVQAERHAIVDFSFAEFFPEVVRYRPGEGSGWPPAAEWYPHLFDYRSRHGERYDYFLVCSDRPLHEDVYRGAPARGSLLAHRGYFWLYSAPPATTPGARRATATTATTPDLNRAAAQQTPEPPATTDVPASR